MRRVTPEIEAMVVRLQRLPLSEARRELSRTLTVPRTSAGFDPALLQRNALLVTALREAKILIWGDK